MAIAVYEPVANNPLLKENIVSLTKLLLLSSLYISCKNENFFPNICIEFWFQIFICKHGKSLLQCLAIGWIITT